MYDSQQFPDEMRTRGSKNFQSENFYFFFTQVRIYRAQVSIKKTYFSHYSLHIIAQQFQNNFNMLLDLKTDTFEC